ncbi:hypothetical protein Leryth_017227 [Lithospermum erythrorhizon]|nr:hypothetical protein Leryth_017227 [Lithospermum erythrorhizon]
MAIFDLHHPWSFTFGILGNIISFFVYFAPLPTFIRIRREKSTMGFQSLPYVVALFSAMLWMYYALIKTNTLLLISINSFGCVIETIYIFIFLLYANKKARNDTAKLLSFLNVGVFLTIFFFTYYILEGQTRVAVVGWICVAFSVIVFAAPLSIVFQVVRTKSAEFLPFPLSFCLTLSAIMWFGYGLLQKDLCIALPNVLGFFLGMLQMLLYGIYRNPKKVVVEEKKPTEHVINIVNLGASEVHPVEDSPKSRKSDDEVAYIEEENKDKKMDEDEENLEFVNEEEQIQECKASVKIDVPIQLVVCAA